MLIHLTLTPVDYRFSDVFLLPAWLWFVHLASIRLVKQLKTNLVKQVYNCRNSQTVHVHYKQTNV
jgi:hypothetical protein